jgi:hypothetical protein
MKAFQGKTCAARVVGRYCIIVHSKEAPSEEEWKQLVDVQMSAPNDGAIRLLVWSDGGAPNASQRAALTVRAAGLRMIAAVLTPSIIARAAATAIRLLQPDVRILSPNALDKAFEFLDVPQRERAQLTSSLHDVRNQLKAVAEARPG